MLRDFRDPSISVFHLLNTGVMSMEHLAWLFMWVLSTMFRSSACEAITLQTDTPSQPGKLFLLIELFTHYFNLSLLQLED